MSRKAIGKAREIFDLKIEFVSLVDAAANKRQFLLAKSKDAKNFTAKIVKADPETHYVTGVVYEPMTEDTQGDYMTEEEIQKAAYWFAKFGSGTDIQHSFVRDEHCSVVESWIAKADFTIDDEQVKKGTWLMTVEICDDELWGAIEKGEITGFSMGGSGKTNGEETNLDEKKSMLQKFAEFLGFEKSVTETYEETTKNHNFFDAFDALETELRHYDPVTDSMVYVTDEAQIRKALEEFQTIITDMLTGTEPLYKSLVPAATQGDGLGSSIDSGKTDPVEKGEQQSNITKEEIDVSKEELTEIVKQAVAEALATKEPEPQADQQTDQQAEVEKAETKLTEDAIKQIVAEEIAKAKEAAAEKQEAEQTEVEKMRAMIAETVKSEMAGVIEANRLPSNLNDEGVKKSNDPHYLTGIL